MCAAVLYLGQQVPEAARDQIKRAGTAVTRVSLAFPLRANGSADAGQKGVVFAFLPIASYGFRWACQDIWRGACCATVLPAMCHVPCQVALLRARQ
jgi:hypothetical protein